jgi:hypothetical protein
MSTPEPQVLSRARPMSTRRHRDGSVTITIPGEKPFRVWPMGQK